MKFLICLAALAALAAASPYDSSARTLSQSLDIQEDGQYGYEYSADNGIQGQESGVGGQYAQGRSSWVSPEGETIEFSYIADENGYQPTGTHVPKTPEYILRALEYIRSQPVYDARSNTGFVHKPTTTHFKSVVQKPVYSQFKPQFQGFQRKF